MGAYISWLTAGSPNPNIVYFDVVLNETHNLSATITEHAVEQGVNVTDHVRPNVDKVSLEGFVSNTPLPSVGSLFNNNMNQQIVTLNTPQVIFGTLNSAFNFVSPVLQGRSLSPNFNVNIYAVANATDFVKQTYDTLNTLRLTATFVDVIAPNAFYKNMVVENVQMTRSAKDGTGATFKVDLREIRTVATSITQAPLPAITRASEPQQVGNQSTVTPTSSQDQGNLSALKFLKQFGSAVP